MFGVVMPVAMLVAVAVAVLSLGRTRQLRWMLYVTALVLLPVAAYAGLAVSRCSCGGQS